MKLKLVWQSLAVSLVMLTTMAVTQAEVKHVSPYGFMVENDIVSNASPAQVWHALIKDVNSWWPKDHTWWGEAGTLSIIPAPGGCFCEVAADKSAQHMLIVFVEPQKLLRMTGGLGPLQGMGLYGALTWTIEEIENGTKVVLTYNVSGVSVDGFAQLAPVVAQVQKSQLDSLKTYMQKYQP